MFDKLIHLAGHAVMVSCDDSKAQEMLSFMFDDIPGGEYASIEAHFWIKQAANKTNGTWVISKDEEQLYQNKSLTDAANYLMGEVLLHLMTNNRKYMAIHAALVSDTHGGILVPGESGNGKSSLSIWMTLNGYHYHTDELVMIKPGSLETRVFTRPLNIKSHGIAAIENLIDIDELDPAVSKGDFITMIPHRALNPDFIESSPRISRLLFPKYSRDADNSLSPLSGAAAGIELMKTNVIARNLPGHGFEQLLDIVKTVPAFKLNYNHFDALPALLEEMQQAA